MTEKDMAVLKRVHDFLGVLIREDLIKYSPVLDEEPALMVSDLADDLHDVIKTPPRNCDVGDAYEQEERFALWRKHEGCDSYPEIVLRWSQKPYKEGDAE